MASCASYSQSAPGMEGVPPQDYKVLPTIAMDWIVCILKLVEGGHPWPKDTPHIAAHMLAKDTTNSLSPLEYIILMITPSIYRIWGRLRLTQVQPWVEELFLSEMFAGKPGISAQDAWYGASADFELAHLQDTAYAGDTLDLYKCFDQVCKPLLTSILLLAGFPKGVMAAYFTFH